ncbi:MAG: DNA methyltransferase [Candidatus Kaiserbacteria bacterium]|nr:DNA methyltransferase [Candidatus Kaiserbacteria bacterium]
MSPLNFKEGTIWVRDNLHIIRGMNSNCIDLIYLDPPFKSDVKYRGLPTDFGGDGVVKAEFNDMWKLRDTDVTWHNSLEKDNRCIYEVIEASEFSFGKDMKSYLIYMTARLFEMHRVLKETGSIYLHCDYHAGHYLKTILDCVFGHGNFRNEIVWQRDIPGKGAKKGSKQFPRTHDTILFYSKGKEYLFNQITAELSEKQKKAYRYTEKSGRKYKAVQLGDYSEKSISEMEEKGLIHVSSTGKKYKKYYLDEAEATVGNIWTDILGFGTKTAAGERTGYPTQKPLELMHRIIKASSGEGDIVLDPLCGCATALVAAEQLNRRWVGIDISPVARFLVRNRMRKETNLFDTYDPISRTDPPVRTDVGKRAKETRQEMRQRLYVEQDALCNGCFWNIPLHIMNDDHITPKSGGGPDVPENIQLLCGTCNSIKGGRDMAYLHTRLKELGYMNPEHE